MTTYDDDAVQDFAERLRDIYTGSMLSKLIRIGYATGLLEGLAAAPVTSEALAGRLHLEERYVREWLGALATAGIVEYEPEGRTYLLPPAHAVLLTGPGAGNLAPLATMVENLGKVLPAIEDCFHEGGGVSYDAFRPDFAQAIDDLSRRVFDDSLVEALLPAAPDLVARLRAGCRAADVGCGTGHAVNVMARAFPASTFVGYDLGAYAIERAREEAADLGVANATFEVRDVASLPADPAFDVVFAFDAVHDQADPAGVLARIHEALSPSGILFMLEPKFASDVAGNIGNPFAPLYYGVSLLHCMTVSLAEGGAGLGAVWGVETAQEMLAEAGFARVEVLDTPRPQSCVYVCRK